MVTKRICILTTGGTISGHDSLSLYESNNLLWNENFQDPLQPALMLWRDLWKLDVRITVRRITNIDSSNIQLSHWDSLLQAIKADYDTYDGFVILHGTNTMAYTCAALSFALPNVGKPVIVSGSQVSIYQPGSDALRNLENAVRVAAWPYSRGLRGVICVFGSMIISGLRVKKMTDFDYETMNSFLREPIGRIGRVIELNDAELERHHSFLSLTAPEARTATELMVEPQFDSRVLSLAEFPGMDPQRLGLHLEHLVRSCGPHNIRGVVLSAYGAGDVNIDLHVCLKYLKDEQIPVVITTQALFGNSSLNVNAPGQLLKTHQLAVPGNDMSLEVATTKLMWLLGKDLNYQAICDAMATNLRGEITLDKKLIYSDIVASK